MTELKTFKIKQEFKGIEGLYKYLLKNVKTISELTGVQIQKPLKEKLFCLVGKELVTERNILFFASKSEFVESLGELIILASTFNTDIVIFFLPRLNITWLEPLHWLHSISNPDTQFIVAEADF